MDATNPAPGHPRQRPMRVHLGETLSLRSLAPVIEEFRAALRSCAGLVELDSRGVQSVTEGASLLLAAEIARAERAGIRFEMAA